MPLLPLILIQSTANGPMTLPGFEYPDQSAWGWIPGAWQERTARRILESLDQDTYLPILDQTIPPADQRSF